MEVSIPRQESEWSCTYLYMCLCNIDFASVCTILRLDFVTVTTNWCFVFNFISKFQKLTCAYLKGYDEE